VMLLKPVKESESGPQKRGASEPTSSIRPLTIGSL
jgi:hypothetical protein